MEPRDFRRNKSNWILRPAFGLGPICLGSNILEWADLLSLKYKGDLDTQMRRYFKEVHGKIKKPNPNLMDCDFLYESNEFDLELYSDDNKNISDIAVGECCIFEGVDLINAKISKITSLWGLPSSTDQDAFGFDFFYDEMGLNVRFDEYRRVVCISISEPRED